MSADDLQRLRRSYRAAFLRCVTATDESALHAGYEIGRFAVTRGLSLLDLAQTHHQVLLEVLRGTRHDELERVAGAASDFLVEVLATFDMAQRGLQHNVGPPPVTRTDAPAAGSPSSSTNSCG